MSDAFTQAVRAFQAGRLDQAEAAARSLLATDPGHVGAMQLLGACLISAERSREGLEWMSRAAETAGTADAWYNLGSARLRAGQAETALEAFDQALERAPELASAWMNRGAALDALGLSEEARAAYARVLALDSRHPGALNNKAQMDLEAGQAVEAEAGFRQCLSVDPVRKSAQVGLGLALLAQGRTTEALAVGRAATRAWPDSDSAWETLGRVLMASDRADEAVAAYRRALALAPGRPDRLNDLGAALFAVQDIEAAESCFRQAVDADPRHAEAWGNWAQLLDTVGRENELGEVLERGLQACPDSPGLRLMAIRRQSREDSPEAALDALDELLSTTLPEATAREAGFERARLLDRIGRHEQAYAAFRSANERALADWRRCHTESDVLLASCRGLRAKLEAGWGADWTASEPVTGPVPAFLLGFQRSGTTLLDTMLGAHGGIHVMEEQPVLNRVIDRIDRRYGGYPDGLAGLNGGALQALREFYWRTAGELSGWEPGQDQLLLDKSPLNSMHGALIARLFPGARVVHLLRHPADVCLSGFMQDFTLTPFMARYTSLAGVAEVYDEVMALWEAAVDAFALEVHRLTYESLVEAPETVLRGLLAFLGLDWRESVLDHTAHARDRGVIDTPSFRQIQQPLYRSARHRWRNYRDALAEVWPMLAPWIERYGYAEVER